MSKSTTPRHGERYIKVFFCHGCQTCFRLDDNDQLIQREHVLHSEDVTDEIIYLKMQTKGLGLEAKDQSESDTAMSDNIPELSDESAGNISTKSE